MNNNQGHFIQNNSQPYAGWPQGNQQQPNQTNQTVSTNRARIMQQLYNNSQAAMAAAQATRESTHNNMNGNQTPNNTGAPNVQFSLPANLALPTVPVQSQPPQTTTNVIVPTPGQSVINQHFSTVNNTPSGHAQSPMASPTSTSHSTAAASSQPSVSNVNHSNMNSNSPIASVAAADAIAGSVAQGTNNNSTSTTAIASATVVSPISISAETSPLTPTVVQNPTQAQDLANKQQQDLLLILNQLRQKQQQQQPQPQQRSPSFQRGVSVPQSPISPQHPPQPRQQSPCQQQQPSQVQQKNMDSTISHRNNLRLSQLQKEISSATMYGPACDEFLEWLQDVRAYNIANEAALVKCANAVRNNFQVGRWSSLQIFDTIFRFINHLSEPSRVKITQWRDEIRSATMGEVSGRSSASSRSQTSSPVATSLANMAIRHAPSSDPSSDPSLPQRSPHLNRSLPTTSMSPQHTPIQSVPSNIPLQQRLQIQQQQRQHFQQLHQSMMIPTSIPPAQPQQYMFQLPHHPIHQQPQPHNINIPQHTQPAQQSLSTSPSSLQPGIQVQQQQLEQMIWNTYTAAMNNQNRPLGMALTAANNGPMVGQQQLPQQLSQQPPPPPQNQLPFIRKIGYAVSPFRLKHNQKITKTPFFIDNDQFSRMWRGMQQGPMNPNRLPLSYVLTSWRDQTLENKCEWPDAIKIQLNRTIPNLTKRRKTRVPGRSDNVFSYQGKDKPLDAGNYLTQGHNELVIEQLDCACSYYFAIIVFIRESEEIITEGVKSRMLDINKGRGIVNRLLGKTNDGKENTDDDDIQIHQTNVKIGLKCPISLQRIKLPTKGETCKHADCFDLSPYLAVNHENPSWKCPHCNEYTPPNKLYRDAFFEDLLQRVGKVAVEVEFKDDAEHFRVIKSETPDPEDQEQEKSLDTGVQSASESTTKTPKVEPDVERNVISLLSDDEDEEHEKQEEENEVNGQQTAVAGNESNNYSTNGNRKRAADTEESIQTTQSESSVEKSPATPGNLVANKRSRHDDDSFQYQFAPMDANQLLNSFFALASASGNGTINNNDDNNNGNNGTQ